MSIAASPIAERAIAETSRAARTKRAPLSRQVVAKPDLVIRPEVR